MTCRNASNEIDLEDMFKMLKNNDDIKENIEKNKTLFEYCPTLHHGNYKDRSDFLTKLANYQRSIKNIFRKSVLRNIYKIWCEQKNITPKPQILQWLLKNAVRSGSGIVVNTVFTSPTPEYTDDNGKLITVPYSCKYNCYYCPDEPAHEGNGYQKQARSYVYDGPSTRRANENGFHPVRQFYSRAKTLLEIGHEVDKIETIVLGGTWSTYPIKYRDWFCKMIFYAANMLYEHTYRKPYSLEREIELNETSKCHIIGFTIETRPDCINPEEIYRFRKQGITRVQLGIQHTNDKILKKVNRGCYQKDTIYALKLLKNACYKVDIHVMPDLCSTPEQDREMFNELLYNTDYGADQIKIYPLYISKWTIIKKWYDEGKFVPQNIEDVIDNIVYFMERVSISKRINRVGRDIPTKDKHGNPYLFGDLSCMDLRSVIQGRMKKMGVKSSEIRSREPQWDEKNDKLVKLYSKIEHENDGREYFISMEDRVNDKIYGFLRLRLTNQYTIGFLSKYALIRELHVYGPVVKVDSSNDKSSQHSGYGKIMMNYAEKIAIRNGYKKMAVISGVGVRNYYRKLGYRLEETFMVKDLDYYKYHFMNAFLNTMFLFVMVEIVLFFMYTIIKLYFTMN